MAQTKLPSSQLNLSVTTDANGWTVYDHGTFKRYRKSYYNTGWAFATGETDVTFQTWSMPVGVTLTTDNVHIVGCDLWASTSWSGHMRAVRANVSGSNIIVQGHFNNTSGATNNWSLDIVVEAVV